VRRFRKDDPIRSKVEPAKRLVCALACFDPRTSELRKEAARSWMSYLGTSHRVLLVSQSRYIIVRALAGRFGFLRLLRITITYRDSPTPWAVVPGLSKPRFCTPFALPRLQ
jgi:hypothetical protein